MKLNFNGNIELITAQQILFLFEERGLISKSYRGRFGEDAKNKRYSDGGCQNGWLLLDSMHDGWGCHCVAGWHMQGM